MITNLPVGLNFTTTSTSSSANRLPIEAVFPFCCFSVFLTLRNFAGKNTSLNIINSQTIIVHFLFCMESHHIFTFANLIAYLSQNSIKHCYPLIYFPFPRTPFPHNVRRQHVAVLRTHID